MCMGERGWGTACLCTFPLSPTHKWKCSKLIFFDVLTIHTDQISHAKHVLDPPYEFFTLFGCWTVDGGLVNDLVSS